MEEKSSRRYRWGLKKIRVSESFFFKHVAASPAALTPFRPRLREAGTELFSLYLEVRWVQWGP